MKMFLGLVGAVIAAAGAVLLLLGIIGFVAGASAAWLIGPGAMLLAASTLFISASDARA